MQSINVCIIILYYIIDINECEGINDCQQECVNTEGTYNCNCMDGFSLADDARNCTGKSNSILVQIPYLCMTFYWHNIIMQQKFFVRAARANAWAMPYVPF